MKDPHGAVWLVGCLFLKVVKSCGIEELKKESFAEIGPNTCMFWRPRFLSSQSSHSSVGTPGFAAASHIATGMLDWYPSEHKCNVYSR